MEKEIYNINIQIYNKHGELVDKLYQFKTLDEARNLNWDNVVDQAEDYGRENLMLLEELEN